MTAQDWLDLLPIVADRGWKVSGRAIRDGDERCPICSLANELSGGSIDYRVSWWAAVAEILFLPYDDDASKLVVHAADIPDHPLRPALMAALGMTQ